MRADAPSRRWLLVVAIAAGLIAMHHLIALGRSHGDPHATVPVVDQPTAAGLIVGAPDGCSCPSHALGHQCLAVLSDNGLALAALSTITFSTTLTDRSRPVRAAAHRPARAPPDSGTRLASLGVWRS